jgi:FKBP-type peptidyl-prolyl cis-trans isomerase FklB
MRDRERRKRNAMMMKPVLLSVLSVSLLASAAFAGDAAALKDRKARESYSLGYQFGHNLLRQGVEVDEEVLVSALREALEGKKPALGEIEMREAVNDLRRRVTSVQEQRARETAAKNLEEANAFLEANKKKEGVITLPSGLQYKVLKEGKGAGPKPTDGVRIRYRGTLVNGMEFDNVMDLADKDVPVIPVSGANRGWREALQLMKPGAKWMLFVPPQLGFGDRPYGRIPANSVLIYELDLLSIAREKGAAKQDASQQSGAPVPEKGK